MAHVSSHPPGERLPAVVFLHGGFEFTEDDWEMTRPYRKRGFVVMMPKLRGENAMPGDYTMFFDEVDDVVAATEARVGVTPRI
jgi:dipeptidyl aminopeptidase/acylaminoacyl peptidase